MGCKQLTDIQVSGLRLVRRSHKIGGGQNRIGHYPFGLLHQGYNNVVQPLGSMYNYGFNGKELQQENGIAWLDFGSRNFDAELGRWFNIDPRGEERPYHSPYMAMGNNPILNIDPDGEFFGSFFTAVYETVANIVDHGVNIDHFDYDRTERAFEIDKGLLIADPTKSFFGQGLEVLSRLTWQAPQTLLGNVTSHALNITGNVNHVEHFRGATVLDTDISGGAFTLGSYLVGPEGFRPDFRDHLFVHEYGHYLQSQRLGPLYLNFVALPSVTDFQLIDGIFGTDLHGTRWYEAQASRLAVNYFDEHFGQGAAGYTPESPDHFDRDSFINDGVLSPYQNPRNERFNRGGNPINSIFHWSDIFVNLPFNGGLGLLGFAFN